MLKLSGISPAASGGLSAKPARPGTVVRPAGGTRRGPWTRIGAVFSRGLCGSEKRAVICLPQVRRLRGRLWLRFRLVAICLLAVERDRGTLQGGAQGRVALGARHRGVVERQVSGIGLLQTNKLSVHHFLTDRLVGNPCKASTISGVHLDVVGNPELQGPAKCCSTVVRLKAICYCLGCRFPIAPNLVTCGDAPRSWLTVRRQVRTWTDFCDVESWYRST